MDAWAGATSGLTIRHPTALPDPDVVTHTESIRKTVGEALTRGGFGDDVVGREAILEALRKTLAI